MKDCLGKTSRLVGVLLAVLLVLMAPLGSIAHADSTHLSDKADSFITISSESDLINLWNFMSRGGNTQNTNYKLNRDIVLKSGVKPPDVSFKGVFDGNGHNVTLNIESDAKAGLFSAISKEATIKNLTIKGEVKGSEATGGISGVNYGIIERCKNYAMIKGSNYSTGGIAGENYGVIKESANEGAVKSSFYSGGIAGTQYGTLYSCYNKAEVTGKDSGGIAGVLRDGWIISCYNRGDVKGTNLYAGGIVAKRYKAHTLVNSYNTGNVTLDNKNKDEKENLWGCGAINGFSYYYNCYYDKDVPTLGKINKQDNIIPEEKTGGLNSQTLKNDATIAKLNSLRVEGEGEPGKWWFNQIKEWDLKQYAPDSNTINDGYPILYWQREDSRSDFDNHWAKDSINKLIKEGIMDLTNGKFEPDREVTRAEFADIIVNLLDLTPVNTGKETFVDVPKSNKYYHQIETAAKYRIVKGVGHGKYDPDAGIKKEELIAIVIRALDHEGINTDISEKEALSLISKFTDGLFTADWAVKEVGWGIKNGLIESRILMPKEVVVQDNVNRGETASIIANALNLIEK